jgi:hypothetical protein
MAIQKHKAQTRSECLICSMDALTAAINRLLDRLPELPADQPALNNTRLHTGEVKTVLLSSPR